MGSLWESFILSVQVCACERAESDGGICIAAKEPTIGTTWRSLCLFYREHRIKTLRSAAGKYGPPLLKREMSNRWLAPCPPVPLMLRAPGRKLTQLLWPKPDTHTHTQTTGEALLLGQDETDPDQKKLLLFIPRNGATLLVSTDDNKPSSKQTLQRRTVCRWGHCGTKQSDLRGHAAEIPSHHSGFVRALIDCLALDDTFSVEPYRLL